jgi:hypothetical protein
VPGTIAGSGVGVGVGVGVGDGVGVGLTVGVADRVGVGRNVPSGDRMADGDGSAGAHAARTIAASSATIRCEAADRRRHPIPAILPGP